jgi:polyisoprenoid-binding protein YceI
MPGPGGLKIDGTSNELTVNESSDNVAVVVPLRGLDTKIELRNKHMREKYLETDKYPNAELTVARSALKFPDATPVSGEADGVMKMHGREHPVRFKYDAKKAGAGYQVNGSVRVDIRHYGITEPSFMGASVKPEVDVQVNFTVSEQ